MTYRPALDLLENIGKKLRLQILTLVPSQSSSTRVDFGLRDFLSLQESYDLLFRDKLLLARPNTIYRLQDEFFCNYIYLVLPGETRHTVLIAGPYITFEIRHEDFLEQAERYGVPPWLHKRMEDYFLNLPVIQDASVLINLFSAFGETIWGGADRFEIVDLDHEFDFPLTPTFSIREEDTTQQLLLDMQIMQTRYDSENELMQIVSRGQIHRAERLSAGFVPSVLQSRMADPMRNMKNFCIIGNTLMRKAAEHGGVHPVYLDRASSEFAKRIESTSQLSAGQALFGDMVRTYCRLVRKHKAQHYSPQVEKAVLCIEADLSRDLSLSTLAETLGISPGYLSTLFRQETGKTVTDFVTEKRMEHAASLLQGSSLQVQTVAQYCGISDVNYFSKLFKRHHGMTPREFRKTDTSK